MIDKIQIEVRVSKTGDDPKAAYNGQVPPTQLNRAELTLSPHLRTVRNLLQFNMVDAAFKTMQETLQKTPILTSSYGDVSRLCTMSGKFNKVVDPLALRTARS